MLTADDFSDTLWDLLRRAPGRQGELERLLAAQPRDVIAEFYNEFVQAGPTAAPDAARDVGSGSS